MNEISQSEALAKLQPEAYQPTEAEDKLAIIQYIYDNILWYHMQHMVEFMKTIKSGVEASDDVKQQAIKSSDILNKCMDEEQDDAWWTSYVSNINMQFLKERLSAMHQGDCTAVAATCSRCMAETLYNIPSTVTWNKHDGHKLLRIAFPNVR